MILGLGLSLTSGWNALPHSFGRSVVASLPGVGLCMVIALGAMFVAGLPWFQSRGLSALVMAMIAGAAAGNLFRDQLAGRCQPGIALSKQRLLRLGVILYGVRLTLSDVAVIGMPGVLVDALVLVTTFLLALFIGVRLLKMDPGTVMLIGAGSSICGAAAVLATEPVVRARPEQVTVAVATVVVFGTLATFLYPFLYRLNGDWQLLQVSSLSFGLYVGSTVHEVAQVVAAAQLVDADAANVAVVAKMVRVMMLPLFLVALSAFLMQAARRLRAAGRGGDTEKRTLTVPWFALGFLAVVMLNSTIALPPAMVERLTDVDTLLLTIAMAALGLTTHVSAFRQAGFKPMLLAAVLFVWLVAGGAWINRLASL